MKRVFLCVAFFLLLPVLLLGENSRNSSKELLEKYALKIRQGYAKTVYHEVTRDTLFKPFGKNARPPRVEIREIWYASPQKIRIEKKRGGEIRWIIIRRGDKMFFKKENKWRVRPAPPETGPVERGSFLQIRGEPYLDLVVQNYQIKTKEVWSFLGRKLNVLTIDPKFPLRFAWKFWIDSETGLVLRRVQKAVEKSGTRTLFVSTVREIDFPKMLPDSLFEVPANRVTEMERRHRRHHSRHGRQREYRDENVLLKEAPFPVFLPRPLPEGFAFVKGFWVQRHHDYMAQTHFSDGLLDFSIFQIQAREEMQRRLMQHFRRPPHGREPFMRIQTVFGKKEGFAFLILGNVPKPCLKKILDSLAPPPPKP